MRERTNPFSRRRFLGAGLTTLGAVSLPSLAVAAEDESKLKITGHQVYLVANPEPLKGGKAFVILKLMTNRGIVGWGEASVMVDRGRTVVELFRDLAEAHVIGSSPFRVERLFTNTYKAKYGLQHPDLMRLPVISAFEIACWDIIGKALDQPIYNLLGGRCHDRLRTYTYMFQYTTGLGFTLDDAVENAGRLVEQGFTAFGFDPAWPPLPRPRTMTLSELREAEDAVRVVRETVGDRCDILLKAHGQLTTASAIRLAKRVEPYDPLWLEEPVPLENVDELARVARSTSIPIATGERFTTKFEFQEVLARQAAQILNVAVGRVGGILEAKKVAALAEAHYAQIAPWMSTGPIAAAASVQLDTCCENFLLQEGIERWDGFHAELLVDPLRWEKGYVYPPTGPGLGVELNEVVAAKHPYDG
jgi:2-dehydro-3-deoxyphosphogalactonate aldolase